MAASGNVAEALQAYEELRRLLRDELGVTPAPEVQALHQQLLDGDSRPSARPPRTARVRYRRSCRPATAPHSWAATRSS